MTAANVPWQTPDKPRSINMLIVSFNKRKEQLQASMSCRASDGFSLAFHGLAAPGVARQGEDWCGQEDSNLHGVTR